MSDWAPWEPLPDGNNNNKDGKDLKDLKDANNIVPFTNNSDFSNQFTKDGLFIKDQINQKLTERGFASNKYSFAVEGVSDIRSEVNIGSRLEMMPSRGNQFDTKRNDQYNEHRFFNNTNKVEYNDPMRSVDTRHSQYEINEKKSK